MQVPDSAAQTPLAFLSHASEDKATFAEPLGRALAQLGVRPWLDKWEIRPGDSLVRRLFDDGLAGADAVIVIVSAASVTKPWVREELDSAAVRRIEEGTRLIPVRLDDVEMPAPLRHLLWRNAERSEAGVAETARAIADTMHGHDPRPAVAPPPAYAATPASVPGLTRADTFLLAETVREALDSHFRLGLNWPAIQARAEQAGLTGDALVESREALALARYIEVTINGGMWVVRYDLTRRGYAAGIRALTPDIDETWQRMIAILATDPPTSDQAVEDLAERANAPVLLAYELLDDLRDRGLVDFTRTAGGSRLPRVSPTLRRLLA